MCIVKIGAMSSPSPAPLASATVEILDAMPHHMAAVQSIYSHYVLHDLCSFEEEVPSVDQMQQRRADVLARGMPYLVAMLDGKVAGYAYATAYRARSAYRHSVEDSVYVAQGMHGHGIGKALLHRGDTALHRGRLHADGRLRGQQRQCGLAAAT